MTAVSFGSPNHNGEGGTSLRDNLVPLVGQIGNANGRRALGSGRSHLELRMERNEIKTDEGIKKSTAKITARTIGEGGEVGARGEVLG